MKKSTGFMLFMACLGLIGVTGAAIASSSIRDNVVFATQNQIVSCYDHFTASKLAATSTSYKDFTAGNYIGNSAKTSDGAIQLRSAKSTSGFVTTISPGKLHKIEVQWNNETSAAGDRQLDFYGKNTAYTAASELYGSNKQRQGTKLGSIVCGTDTELDITTDFDYIGFRSKSGALYIDSITLYYHR